MGIDNVTDRQTMTGTSYVWARWSDARVLDGQIGRWIRHDKIL